MAKKQTAQPSLRSWVTSAPWSQVTQRNLKADDVIITATLNGVNGQGGQIDQVKAKVSAHPDAIDKDNAMIAGGAVYGSRRDPDSGGRGLQRRD